jgi:hypothetical protein
MSGHVHVIAGDITRLACDAWLLPTDGDFKISGSFARAIGVEPNTCLSLTWGDARVVPLPRLKGPTETEHSPSIWLGNVGSSKANASWFAGIVAPFVETAMQSLTTTLGARPLLAVNVLGTGQGGMAADKGDIYKALLPALHEATSRYNTDLVLVCWGRRSYSAAQRVRQQLLRERDGGKVSAMWSLGSRQHDLELLASRLAEEARRHDLVVFAGAGVSAGAGLLAWQGLLDAIAGEVADGIPLERLKQLDVRDQAALLQRRLRSAGKSLHATIAKHIDRTRYALTHGHIASLPVREIVTTNYDRLMENALDPVEGPAAVLPYEPVGPDQRWVLKLHGSIDRDESVVLTRSDYLSIPARHSALFGLVQAMLLTRHMLFVGYSLTDEDFHQVVHDVRQARAGGTHGQFGTVLVLFDDPLFTELWSDDLTVVAVVEQPADTPSSVEIGEAARTLGILLDLVAFRAADLDAFLLDGTYSGLMSDAEKSLAEHLTPLVAAITSPDTVGMPAADRVRHLLEQFGAQNLRRDRGSL